MHRNFSFSLLHCYSAMDVLQMQMQHCNIYQNNQDLSLMSGSDILPIYWSCRASAIYDLPINLRYIHKRVPALARAHVEPSYAAVPKFFFDKVALILQIFLLFFWRNSVAVWLWKWVDPLTLVVCCHTEMKKCSLVVFQTEMTHCQNMLSTVVHWNPGLQ